MSFCLQELCLSLMLQLAKAGSFSESFSVYNMLRYSNRNVCKSLHETMLNILVEAGLLKDAYVVVKDNMEMISTPSFEKFAASFMKSGNINLINDVVKAFHCLGHNVDAEIFRVAISRYIGKPEKKGLLLSLLKWMQTHGYVVDSSSRNLLLKNSHLFGQKQARDDNFVKPTGRQRTFPSHVFIDGVSSKDTVGSENSATASARTFLLFGEGVLTDKFRGKFWKADGFVDKTLPRDFALILRGLHDLSSGFGVTTSKLHLLYSIPFLQPKLDGGIPLFGRTKVHITLDDL
ncbi:Pentatricopeptide repeat-containing protein [Dendrobium catenatum]|uniref:Pentatricopeptide repeat-containing protein n=1 Tax=Dendrobium catenatum TaxID=906689 RepID=A0A2I0WXV6_9ASPA|nr:Pentatricopeptide repeat-containing protein [Dendrobium catenatum]